MGEQRILSRVWLLVNTQKKCDYLGCKCVVLTLFRAFEYDISTNKKYRELFLRTRECVLVVLFFFLEVSLLVLLLVVNGFFHTVLVVHTCFIYTQIKKCSLLSLSNKRVFITSGK